MAGFQIEIRVFGAAPVELLGELDGVEVITATVETVLQGSLTDQAELICLVNQLQGLGAELREVRQLGNATGITGRL